VLNYFKTELLPNKVVFCGIILMQNYYYCQIKLNIVELL